LDLYYKALTLDPNNDVLKKEVEIIKIFLEAEADWRNRGILKVFVPIRKLQNSVDAARGVLNQNDPLLALIEKKLNQIRVIRIVALIAFFVILLIIYAQVR
jgi:hypothetical protein